MNRFSVFLMFAPFLVLGSLLTPAAADAKTVRISLATDGPSDSYTALLAQARQEIDLLVSDEIVFSSGADLEGDWSTAGATKALDAALATKPDLVITLGPFLAAEGASREELSAPVLAIPGVSSALVDLPMESGGSGRAKFTHLATTGDIGGDLRRFVEVVPLARTAVLVDAQVHEATPLLDVAAAQLGAELLLEVVLVDVTGDAESVLAAIPEAVDGVYLFAMPRLADDQVEPLLSGLAERKLPSFASFGKNWVERGALASATAPAAWSDAVRRVALHSQLILMGGSVGTLPVHLKRREDLTINMDVARSVGVWPSFAVLIEATLLGGLSAAAGRELDLVSAVEQAVSRSPELAAALESLEAIQKEVGIARGRLLPQLEVGADVRALDKKSANPLVAAEFEASWDLSGSQIIYSEGAWTALGASKRFAEAAEQEFASKVLDLKLRVGLAYVAVLRARAGQELRTVALAQTRENLGTAELRLAAGAGTRSEVHRWEIEIANSRARLVDAVATRRTAEQALNNLLLEPMESPVDLADAGPSGLLGADTRLAAFINDPWTFRAFRDFMVEQALERSPELKAIDSALAARRRILVGEKRSIALPTFALYGGLDHTLARAGEGSEPLDINGVVQLGPPNPFRASVGVGLSWPLFEGGSRFVAVNQAQDRVDEFEEQRRAIVQVVEGEVRASLTRAGAARVGIGLSVSAAEAADSNLALVADAYRVGAVNVITLVDAQTIALSTDLSAADAYYRFLAEYLVSERAGGDFSFERSPEERDALIKELGAFVEERRAAP